MSTKSNSRFNIEVLEPLLLMSASAIDAEPVEIVCGGEDFAWTAQTPDDAAGDTTGDGLWSRAETNENWNGLGADDQSWGFNDGRDANCGPTAWFAGNRADYSAKDHGFGIFAIRCGSDNSTHFLTDVFEIEFSDGKFDIRELTAETRGEEVLEATTLETLDAESAANDVADEAEEFDVLAAEDGVPILTDVDGEIDEFIVTSSVEELTEDVWFTENQSEADFAVQTFLEPDDCAVVVDPLNQGPDGQDDVINTVQDVAVSGTVASNDVDADGDALTFYVEQGPQHGSIEFSTDGSYTYTPDPGFSGTDGFTYEVTDGRGGIDIVEVCVNIEQADDCVVDVAPNNDVEAVDDEFSTDRNQSVDGNVLVNDVDPDGDSLTTSAMTDVLTSSGGLVSLHEDGSFVYVPADGFTGVDTFTYSATDGNGSMASATVTIVVNDVPAPPQDDSYTGDSATEIQGDVTVNDGGDSGEVEVTIVDAPVNGTLTLNSDGTFRYLANDGFSGDDSFTYSMSRCGVVAGISTVRMVVAEVTYDTTYVSAGSNGRVWGDPHFEGDDGGLYDVQGEAGNIYNILSDHDLQVNALYVPWESHEGSTMMGQIGATVGTDLILADETGTFINGVVVEAGEVIALADGQVEYDGEYTTLTTAEYRLRFHRREGWYDMTLAAINPFSDNVAPHGLWGMTVDGDTDARHGDFFKTHGWDYTLQGGGAIDTVDEDGNVVLSETGDRSAYKLYEAANLFSTDALNPDGDSFFRFSARQGTGLMRIS